jgi:hypothetical protein
MVTCLDRRTDAPPTHRYNGMLYGVLVGTLPLPVFEHASRSPVPRRRLRQTAAMGVKNTGTPARFVLPARFRR